MTEIRLYNTRTRQKEAFVPIDPENVRMYVCGPTVYDRAHIGNARPVVVFDVLYRLLRHTYGEDAVTYVRNFTDVDDRIIDKAVATKGADESLEAATRRITNETIDWYHQDMDALGALRPSIKGVVSDRAEPRCTEFIEPMVKMTEELIAKGNAYEAEGHVLFAVESYGDYGRLSGRSVDDMIAGARVEVAPYKRNPMDFVIWKPSTDEQPGWSSPWGRGRPGWHIECSAMAREILGEVFDIHAGGIDLQFPHHENELAQSCCAHGVDRMANWWMHNEMLRVEGEKMSKSLGNFFTVRDLLDQGVPGEVVRFMLLSTHYRQPLDWSARKLEEARSSLKGWYEATQNVEPDPRWLHTVVGHLCDDLNFAQVIAWLHQLSSAGHNADLKAALSFLGFADAEDVEWWRARKGRIAGIEISGPNVETDLLSELIRRWAQLRADKNYSDADQLKVGIEAAGVQLQAKGGRAAHAEIGPDFDPSKLEALK